MVKADVSASPVTVPVGSEPEGWRHARLIPTFGVRSQQEQEKRATSCLLAVMHGVPEFGYALLKELRAQSTRDRDVCRGALHRRHRKDSNPGRCDRLPAGQENVDLSG